ncbi:MAG: pyruvate dehydrogenase (acetyl-transferring), homodimeric type, partial [Porticoccaceae bacterium]
EGVEEGIIKGIYRLRQGAKSARGKPRVQLMGAGTILNEVIAAADMLKELYKVESDIWSVTSVNELARDGQAALRWNRLHPDAKEQVPYITSTLSGQDGPFVIATDYMKSYSEQLRPFIPGDYHVLGTDGYGRSDTRAKLRDFFEVDRRYIAVAALYGLAQQGKIDKTVVKQAIADFGIDPEKSNPLFV